MSMSERPEPPAALASLLDCLLPGDGGRWPAFSAAADAEAMCAALAPPLVARALEWAQALAAIEPERRSETIAAIETAEPTTFCALLEAAYRFYYSAPAVLAAVEALADSGPREASPHFDPALVARVVTSEAGKRRL